MPFQIVRNDITKMKVEAIVNSANPHAGYAAGTDMAIYKAAGEKKLLEAREKIGELERGSAAITPGFKLPAKYIIHTVGPVWTDGLHNEEETLRKCYISSLNLVKENNIESVAFPLISSGNYGFPRGRALAIALEEIQRFLLENETLIYLVVYDKKSFDISSILFPGIDAYIDDNYVEEKRLASYAPNMRIGSFSLGKDDLDIEPDDDFCIESVKCSMSIDGGFDDALPVPKLSQAPKRNLEDVVINLGKSFMEMVFTYADAKGIKDDEIWKRANIDKKAFSKLKCGTTKKPSKNTALALAIALELNLDETRDLLARAEMALSPCSKTDLVVQYFIEREVYDMMAINCALFDHDQPCLGVLA